MGRVEEEEGQVEYILDILLHTWRELIVDLAS